jgi:hypothetical protein
MFKLCAYDSIGLAVIGASALLIVILALAPS